MAAATGGDETFPADGVARLRAAAAAGEVPLLRWGVPLALELLDRMDGDRAVGPWRRSLEKIAASLSPISVWTAWSG
jgi:hypothetical protein